jgi:hypothetical protein
MYRTTESKVEPLILELEDFAAALFRRDRRMYKGKGVFRSMARQLAGRRCHLRAAVCSSAVGVMYGGGSTFKLAFEAVDIEAFAAGVSSASVHRGNGDGRERRGEAYRACSVKSAPSCHWIF